MGQDNFAAVPRLEIDGRPLPAELERLLEEVVVDDHLQLPDMFVCSFRDPNRTVFAQAGVQIGSTITISAAWMRTGTETLLMRGEITGLEAIYDVAGAHAVVRGYDPSHRLHRGRRTETYHNVKDSDVAQTVARRAGLSIGTIDDSANVLDHVPQANVSDWDFLQARAEGIGFELSVRDGRFNFGRQNGSPAQPRELVFGQTLLEFRPRITSAEQVAQVQVRVWDPSEKRVLLGSAQAAASSASLSANPAVLAAKFGAPTYVVADRPLSRQPELESAAGAVAEQIGSAFAEAEGVARGDPNLKAGAAALVSGVASAFVGRYTLTHSRHVFNDDGYRTHFEVSGSQDRTLLGLTAIGRNERQTSGSTPIPGVVIAQVTNNDDPDELGRLKVKLPWLSDSYESDWVRLLQPGAGPNSGIYWVPEVNDEVLVAFEFGDIRRPFVIGGLWNGKDRAPFGHDVFDSGKVKERGFRSRRGHVISFTDDEGSAAVTLVTSDGSIRVSLDEASKDLKLDCTSQATIHITTQGGDLTIESGGNVTISAAGQLELKGQAGVSVECSGAVEVKGAVIKLN